MTDNIELVRLVLAAGSLLVAALAVLGLVVVVGLVLWFGRGLSVKVWTGYGGGSIDLPAPKELKPK